MSRFAITRADGRSHADVLLALVRDEQPGHVYSYAVLIDALSVGTDRTWDLPRVQAAVCRANKRILREVARVLHPVRGVGYRLSSGADHSRLALVHERRSQSQLSAAVRVLRHVQWGEMTPAQRTLHEAHLTITAAVCAQVAQVQRRQARQEEAIAALLSRVASLETR